MQDDELVRLMVDYQAGRLDAFEALYAELAVDVRRFFAGSVIETTAVPDLVQQTFLELHRARRTYRPPLPVRPWVFGIAQNVRRRHRREAARLMRHEGLEAVETVAQAPVPSRGEPLGADVHAALRQVPAGRRRAWLLHHVLGLTFEEVGGRLNIGAGAAKLRSSRAMRTLRVLLGDDRGNDHD